MIFVTIGVVVSRWDEYIFYAFISSVIMLSLFDYEKVLVDIYFTFINTDSSYLFELAEPIFNIINMDNSISQYNKPEVLKASVDFFYFIFKPYKKKHITLFITLHLHYIFLL